MARCAYFYPRSGGRCMYTGCKAEGDMCPAHATFAANDRKREAKREKDRQEIAENGLPPALRRRPRTRPKLGQTSRVQTAREIVDKLPHVPVPFGPPKDPSAPWCSCYDPTADDAECGACGKPHWDTWRRRVAARVSTSSARTPFHPRR